MSNASRKAFALRMDPSLYNALERCAAAELRSVNAQIEILLREALEKRGIKLKQSKVIARGRPPSRT